MKTRMGFISNSSSTSYIIVLPKDFDVDSITEETVDLEKLNQWNQTDKFTIDDVKDAVRRLIATGVVFDWEDGDVALACNAALKNFVVADVDGGSEDGKTVLADRGRVEDILSGKIKLTKVLDKED